MQVVDKLDLASSAFPPWRASTDQSPNDAILQRHFTLQTRRSPHPHEVDRTDTSSGRVLGTVRHTTGMHWSDRDLTKHVDVSRRGDDGLRLAIRG